MPVSLRSTFNVLIRGQIDSRSVVSCARARWLADWLLTRNRHVPLRGVLLHARNFRARCRRQRHHAALPNRTRGALRGHIAGAEGGSKRQGPSAARRAGWRARLRLAESLRAGAHRARSPSCIGTPCMEINTRKHANAHSRGHTHTGTHLGTRKSVDDGRDTVGTAAPSASGICLPLAYEMAMKMPAATATVVGEGGGGRWIHRAGGSRCGWRRAL